MLPAIALRCHGGLPPKECVRQAVAAERAGFATVWFAQNPFSRGAWPAAAACAVATHQIRIGLGVVNPHNRHPTLMAMEIAAFDELSEGRAVLGIGAGIPSRVRRLQAPIDRPIAAVLDAVTITRALLRGESVTYTGKAFSADGVRLDFTPRRGDLPILTAAMGEQALRLCGEIADGVIISNLAPPAFTRRARRGRHRATRWGDGVKNTLPRTVRAARPASPARAPAVPATRQRWPAARRTPPR